MSNLRSTAPPPGYRALPAGLAVLAVDALEQLQADQLKLTLPAIILILVVLLVVYRRLLPAVLAILPSPTPFFSAASSWHSRRSSVCSG